MDPEQALLVASVFHVNVIDSPEDGWEESVIAACTFVLRTSLVKSAAKDVDSLIGVLRAYLLLGPLFMSIIV